MPNQPQSWWYIYLFVSIERSSFPEIHYCEIFDHANQRPVRMQNRGLCHQFIHSQKLAFADFFQAAPETPIQAELRLPCTNRHHPGFDHARTGHSRRLASVHRVVRSSSWYTDTNPVSGLDCLGSRHAGLLKRGTRLPLVRFCRETDRRPGKNDSTENDPTSAALATADLRLRSSSTSD